MRKDDGRRGGHHSPDGVKDIGRRLKIDGGNWDVIHINVHFMPSGSGLLAKQVVEHLRDALKE